MNVDLVSVPNIYSVDALTDFSRTNIYCVADALQRIDEEGCGAVVAEACLSLGVQWTQSWGNANLDNRTWIEDGCVRHSPVPLVYIVRDAGQEGCPIAWIGTSFYNARDAAKELSNESTDAFYLEAHEDSAFCCEAVFGPMKFQQKDPIHG